MLSVFSVVRFLLLFRFLIRRYENQISEFNSPVIALKEDWAGFAFVAIQGSAGDTGNRLSIYNRLAIEDDRDLSANQGDVHRLPFARLFGGIDSRRQKAINSTDLMALGLSAKTIFDLYFVSTAKVAV